VPPKNLPVASPKKNAPLVAPRLQAGILGSVANKKNHHSERSPRSEASLFNPKLNHPHHFARPSHLCCNVPVTMTDYAHQLEGLVPSPLMDNQDTTTLKPPRPDASKTTLPQPGRPVPSRAYPGALIVVEGTDGSGKSTQLYLLKRWLEIGGYRLHFTEWNSSPLVKSATRRGKQKRLLTPTTFSLLHAADFADRCERQIMPLLQGDYLVLADRYIYTAFARDAARGCSHRWLRNLYRFAPIPDIVFYFRAPLDVAVDRILSGRPKLKYYEAGMDLGLSYDRSESFKLFQARILEEYDRMVDSDNFVVLDGTLPVNKLQKQMRDIVASKIDLKRFAPRPDVVE
jgi:dTMP kinase